MRLISIMALFYNNKFGIEPVEIGLILSIGGFVSLLASYLAGRLSDVRGRKPLNAIGSSLLTVSVFMLPLTGT